MDDLTVVVTQLLCRRCIVGKQERESLCLLVVAPRPDSTRRSRIICKSFCHGSTEKLNLFCDNGLPFRERLAVHNATALEGVVEPID